MDLKVYMPLMAPAVFFSNRPRRSRGWLQMWRLDWEGKHLNGVQQWPPFLCVEANCSYLVT